MKHNRVAMTAVVIACLYAGLLVCVRAGSEDPTTEAQFGRQSSAEDRPSLGSQPGILGIVQNARLVRMDGGEPGYSMPARLKTIQPWTAMSPEAAEVPLSGYESRAIMVTGMDQGQWIYSAQIVEVASRTVSAVVWRVFDVPAGVGMSATPIPPIAASDCKE